MSSIDTTWNDANMANAAARRTPPLPRTGIAAVVAAACAVGLTACDPLSITMLSVGAGTGINHQLGGIVYKTFTEPEAKVRKATLAALKRMAIKVDAVAKIDSGEAIKARAADRNIDIELESLTPNTTRMRAVARKEGGILVDSATAIEIIGQTERLLGVNLARNDY
ncbi:MAG: DUF3568 family protein [Rhodocyclaceae bacterium]|nr:DUF3568 family protein [Rhodocyclaceae bacterium]